MSKPFIVIGDQTSHRGVVIEGAPTTDAAGIRIARVGDKVYCPRHRESVIVSGDPTCVIDGQSAARHGDKTSCGAVLIAGQFITSD